MKLAASRATGVWVAIYFAAALGCTDAPKEDAFLNKKNVYLPDDRVVIDSDSYPWRTIGRISECGCTGTLVSPDLVLTAAHCVIDPETRELRSDLPLMQFAPNLRAGQALNQCGIERVWWGTSEPGTYRAEDWAILKLSEPLGDTYGWLGVSASDLDTFPDNLIVVGYSGDVDDGYSPTVDWVGTTRVRDAANGFILHDCDITRGSSGGPVLAWNDKGQLAIVGLQVAEYREGGEDSLVLEQYGVEHANVAIPSVGFVAKLAELRQSESPASEGSKVGVGGEATIPFLEGTSPGNPAAKRNKSAVRTQSVSAHAGGGEATVTKKGNP